MAAEDLGLVLRRYEPQAAEEIYELGERVAVVVRGRRSLDLWAVRGGKADRVETSPRADDVLAELAPERVEQMRRVRRGYEATRRGDLEATLEFIHPEVEMRTPFADAEGIVYRGHDGYRAWHAQLDETWADWRFEPELFIDLDERFAVIIQFTARARESGLPFEQRMCNVWEREDGLARRLRIHVHVEDGLRALGLEPERA